jgi:polyhydroxybutyrate depolymerase
MALNQTIRLQVGPWQRLYRVRGPTPRPGLRLPVVLMLPGAGATAAWTLTETGWGEMAEQEGFLLVVPEASRANPDRPADFLRNPPVWQVRDGTSPLLPPGVDDLAFLDQVLHDLDERFSLDPARFYVTGFSNGASMTFRLALERPGRFAALAPVAGYCPVANPTLARPIPTLFIVGTDDPLIPLQGGEIESPWDVPLSPRLPLQETLHRWAQALGCPLPGHMRSAEEGVRVEVFGPGREGVQFLVYTVAGLGHHWPGGRGQMNPRFAGPASNKLQANRVIWDFFQKQRREERSGV